MFKGSPGCNGEPGDHPPTDTFGIDSLSPTEFWLYAQMHRYIYRPNYRTRARLAAIEFAHVQEHGSIGVGSDRPCVAMHIRHGDKLTEFAKKMWRHDRGSFTHTLNDFVKTGIALAKRHGVDVHDFFLMTDDDDLVSKKQELPDGVKLQFLQGEKRTSSSDMLADKTQFDVSGQNATDSFLSLYTSLHIASRCEFAVVNTGSAISEMILRYACSRQDRCPITHDFHFVQPSGFRTNHEMDGMWKKDIDQLNKWFKTDGQGRR